MWQKMADQCDKALGGIRSGDDISVGGVCESDLCESVVRGR